MSEVCALTRQRGERTTVRERLRAAAGVGLVTLLRQLQVIDAVPKERQNPAVGGPVGDSQEVR